MVDNHIKIYQNYKKTIFEKKELYFCSTQINDKLKSCKIQNK